jgi:hypothetical protein
MRVQIHASRQHELAARIDLARGWPDVPDRADALAGDRDIGVPLAVRCDDEPAADG